MAFDGVWDDPMIKAGIEAFNALLDESSLVQESAEMLNSQAVDRQIAFGGRPLSPYLRPHFLSHPQWSAILSAVRHVYAACEKIPQLAEGHPDVWNELGITDSERELIEVDPGYAGLSTSARLDSFLTPNGLSFVELNAESPAGVGYADRASELLASLPIMRAFTDQMSVRWHPVLPSLLQALVDCWYEFSGSNTAPHIAIVDWEGLPTEPEFEICRAHFMQKGFDTRIVRPEQLSFNGETLSAEGWRIDLVYRRLLMNDALASQPTTTPLLEAYKQRKVCVANNFRCKLSHKKMSFGILTDERYQSAFSQAEREAIQATVPWTRRVADTNTTKEGATVSLLETIRQEQQNLVMKPNDEYGGKGVVVGELVSEQEWHAAIQTALNEDYVVQRKVDTLTEVFPYLHPDGRVEMLDQLLDVDPLIMRGEPVAGFTRLSSSALANVTAGGGMVPIFILESRKV